MNKSIRKRKVQDPDRWYNSLRHYVDFTLFRAYRKIEYVGLEKIPKDGATIIAPNHTNALMDALVVLSMDKQSKVFVARADIFKNPLLAKVLSFLKIMPIMRIRDGIDEVKKNNETIDKSVDVLKDKVPFCILPEGRHRAQHSLLPLSKGIFRIALQTQEAIGDDMPLYIIPFGLEYGNFFRFRSTVLAQVGDPINVSEFVKSHSQLSHPEMMNVMKEELTDKIKDVILYIPDDQYYEETYELCAIAINKQVKNYLKENPQKRKNSLMTRFLANKKTVTQIEKLRKESPKKAETLFNCANIVRSLRVSQGISLASVIIEYPLWNRLLKNLIFIITLPYSIPCSILAAPVSIVSRIIFKKLKDQAFFNSIRYFITLILWPILLLIYTVLAFCLLPWEWALLTSLAISPANIIAQDSFRLLRIMISDIKLSLNKRLRKEIAKTRELYFNLIKF